MVAPMQPTRWPTSGLSPLVCYHVCYVHGGVLSMWVTSGGDSAVKLLTKFGLLEAAVVYATESL